MTREIKRLYHTWGRSLWHLWGRNGRAVWGRIPTVSCAILRK